MASTSPLDTFFKNLFKFYGPSGVVKLELEKLKTHLASLPAETQDRAIKIIDDGPFPSGETSGIAKLNIWAMKLENHDIQWF